MTEALIAVIPGWEYPAAERRWSVQPAALYQRDIETACAQLARTGAEVRIAPVDVDGLETWCAAHHRDPADPAAPQAYAKTVPSDRTVIYRGDVAAALLCGAIQESIAITVARLGADPADLLAEWSPLEAEVMIALGGRIEDDATLTLSGPPTLNMASLGHPARYCLGVELRWHDDHLIGATANHGDLIESLLLLGFLHGADVALACYHAERHPISGHRWQTMYRWRLDRDGLHGLTEAQAFAASCTDIHTGEPIPPGHAVRYASTAFDYLTSPTG